MKATITLREWHSTPAAAIAREEAAWFVLWLKRRGWIWLAAILAAAALGSLQMLGYDKKIAKELNDSYFIVLGPDRFLYQWLWLLAPLLHVCMMAGILQERSIPTFRGDRAKKTPMAGLSGKDLWPALITAPALAGYAAGAMRFLGMYIVGAMINTPPPVGQIDQGYHLREAVLGTMFFGSMLTMYLLLEPACLLDALKTQRFKLSRWKLMNAMIGVRMASGLCFFLPLFTWGILGMNSNESAFVNSGLFMGLSTLAGFSAAISVLYFICLRPSLKWLRESDPFTRVMIDPRRQPETPIETEASA